MTYAVAILLFFGPLCVSLSARSPRLISETVFFAIAFGVPITLVVDYVALVNGAWHIPVSAFPFRVCDQVPLEDVALGVLFLYWISMSYRGSLDAHAGSLSKARVLLVCLLLFTLFVVLCVTPQEYLKAPYMYSCLGLIFAGGPLFLFAYARRSLLRRAFRTTLLAVPVLFVFEIVGLHLGYWAFLSEEYVGWIQLLSYRFPLEELVFWIFLSAPAIAAYYELLCGCKQTPRVGHR